MRSVAGWVGVVCLTALGGLLVACDTGAVPLSDAPTVRDDAPCTAQLAATPQNVVFGTVAVGTTATEQVMIANSGACGALPLSHQLVGPDAADYAVASSTCDGLALAPGTSCTIDLTLSPSDPGTQAARLVIAGGPGPLDVFLDGTGLVDPRQSMSPAMHDFGTVYVGVRSTSRTFTLTNAGGVPLTGITAAFGGSDPSEPSIMRNTCAGGVAPGATCEIDVAWLAQSSGSRSATLMATSNAGTASATVTATAVTPDGIDVTPSVRDFGSVVVGTSSAAATFTVTHQGATATGALATAISGTDAASFSIVDDTCRGATLAPGASCTLGVRFAPTTGVGARNAQLTVSGTPGGSDVALLAGTALPLGDPSLSPTFASYPDTLVGSASASRTFTLTNGTSAASGSYSVALAGADAASFAIDSDTCQGQAVPSMGTCTVTVSFRPASAGAKQAALQLTASPGGSVAATLSGTGVAIAASPATIDFGTAAAPDSPGTEVTVTNPSTTATAALGATLGGADPAAFQILGDSCSGAPLGPLASCTLRVRMTCPFTPGPHAASLDIAASPGGTATVALSGTLPNDACTALIALNPTTGVFGDVTVGTTSAAQPFVLTNNGAVTAMTLALSIAGPDAASFAIASTTCGTTLGPGQSCSIDVTATPLAAGGLTATLMVTQTAGNPVGAALAVTGLP